MLLIKGPFCERRNELVRWQQSGHEAEDAWTWAGPAGRDPDQSPEIPLPTTSVEFPVQLFGVGGGDPFLASPACHLAGEKNKFTGKGKPKCYGLYLDVLPKLLTVKRGGFEGEPESRICGSFMIRCWD